MKTTLNLTNEEGLKLVDAMKNVAIGCGWNVDELAESGVMEEYAAVVEAVFSALGIQVLIDGEPEDDDNDEDFDLDDLDFDDDDEDEDEDDSTPQYAVTPKGEFVVRFMEESGCSFEEACEIADVLFGKGE